MIRGCVYGVDDVAGELVALRGDGARFRLIELLGGVERAIIAGEAPEIVPQTILRLGRIGFVADRRRQ